MRLFEPRAALAEIEKRNPPPATFATSATKSGGGVQNVAVVAKVAAPSARIPKKTDPMPRDEFRHGTAFNGAPKTWTGKIVSFSAWQHLSEWEKHGPDGRMWNGKTLKWEVAVHPETVPKIVT